LIYALKKIYIKDIELIMKFGITQGRLTDTKSNILQKFPKNWKKEFDYLNKTHLDYIEFFLEKKINLKNPIWTSNGRKTINKLIKKTKLKYSIVCDNYIINKSLKSKKILKYYSRLFLLLKKIHCKLLIVPLEGINLIKVDEYNSVIEFIKKINLMSKKSNVNLSFEFNGDISIFKKIIEDTKIINLQITFDTGNFFVKNRNLAKTLKQYETYINHVHLKDRDKFGNNVVLGNGLINFSQVMKFLKSKNYKRCLTFETHRGINAILTANKNFSQIKNFS